MRGAAHPTGSSLGFTDISICGQLEPGFKPPTLESVILNPRYQLRHNFTWVIKSVLLPYSVFLSHLLYIMHTFAQVPGSDLRCRATDLWWRGCTGRPPRSACLARGRWRAARPGRGRCEGSPGSWPCRAAAPRCTWHLAWGGERRGELVHDQTHGIQRWWIPPSRSTSRHDGSQTAAVNIWCINGTGYMCNIWRFSRQCSDLRWLHFRLQCPSLSPPPEHTCELRWPAYPKSGYIVHLLLHWFTWSSKQWW